MAIRQTGKLQIATFGRAGPGPGQHMGKLCTRTLRWCGFRRWIGPDSMHKPRIRVRVSHRDNKLAERECGNSRARCPFGPTSWRFKARQSVRFGNDTRPTDEGTTTTTTTTHNTQQQQQQQQQRRNNSNNNNNNNNNKPDLQRLPRHLRYQGGKRTWYPRTRNTSKRAQVAAM